MSIVHPFDQAIALVPQEDGTFQGRFTPAYGNMVGPYGGIITAALLNALPTHTGQQQADPVSLTVNFAAPIADAEYQITVRLMRNNRSTQHWNMELSQNGEVAATATAVLAHRRATWSATEASMPTAPVVESLRSSRMPGAPRWVSSYDMRFVKGEVTLQPDQQTEDSTSLLWVRDEPPRPLDFVALAAMSDCFFPRIFVRRQQLALIGTITLTTYFHADRAALTQQSDKHLLAEAHANRFYNGYFDQGAKLWGADGTLLATSHQLVYFKA